MKKLAVALIVASFFAWGVPANAEMGPGEKLGAACKEELANFCSNVVIGQGRIIKCLEKNKDKISAECNTAMINAKKQVEAQKTAN